MSQFSATALINAFIITIVHIRTMVLTGQPILNMGTVEQITFMIEEELKNIEKP